MNGLLTQVGQATNNLGLFVNTYQIAKSFTAEQVRTLNSVPIEMIPAQGENTVIVPQSIVVAFKATDPAVPFDQTVALEYEVGTASPTATQNFDGSATTSWTEPPAVVPTPFTGDNDTFEGASMINAALVLTTSGDVADGDGTLTVIVTYQVVSLEGLI